MERIAIFAALPWECRTALHPLRDVRRTRLGAFIMWQGRASEREVWVVKTGVGVQRAAAAVDAACAAQTFAMIVSTGCAGGLVSVLQPGDTPWRRGQRRPHQRRHDDRTPRRAPVP
jgi:nucleoside phosphorylase